jgi:DNA polymerase-3 subunit delta'
MLHNWTIIGHNKQKEFLSKIIDSGKIAHAYVFAGPDGVGKKSLALNLAKILLCEKGIACGDCNQCKSFRTTQPDYIELKQNEIFKIEQIRQLIYKLSLKSYQGKYKVAVIDNADNMTVEAANALLKSMEEPKAYTIVILITANPYRLLPTILSRAQKINFGLVSESEYQSLIPANLSIEQKRTLKTFAAGRPGIAKALVSDNSETQILENLLIINAQCERFLRGDVPDRIKVATELAELETPDLKSVLQFWLGNLEHQLVSAPSALIAAKISSVAKAKNLLEANVNAKLLLTQMVLG